MSMTDSALEESAGENGVPTELPSTLNVDAIVEKLINFKNTGKQVSDAMIQSVSSSSCN